MISQETMQNALSWAWDASVNGLPGSESAEQLAQDYLDDNDTREDAIDSLIFGQVAKCTLSGFVTSLSGAVILPIAIPTNLASTLYVQMRMVAAIAYMCGKDIHSDQVQTMGDICLCGNAGKEVLKKAGIGVGTRLASQSIKMLPRASLAAINKAVGIKLVTKFGQKGIINLGKAVPLAGGFIGSALDVVTTKAIAAMAKRNFYKRN